MAQSVNTFWNPHYCCTFSQFYPECVLWEVEKTGHKKCLLIPVYGTGVNPSAFGSRALFSIIIKVIVCLSEFWKIMTHCCTHGQIWTKFSGLSRLVVAYLRVGCTSAQSPPCRTGPAYSPFSWSLSTPWLLVLLGHVIPFWKPFDEVNHNVRADFWFLTF